MHEGDEGAHDEARPGTHERGDLVRDRLAAAGRHQDDRVAAGDDLIDDRGLIPAEVVVAEDVFEDGARVLARPRRGRRGAEEEGAAAGGVAAIARANAPAYPSNSGGGALSYSSGGVSSSTSHGMSA